MPDVSVLAPHVRLGRRQEEGGGKGEARLTSQGAPLCPYYVYIGRTNGLLSHKPISNPNPSWINILLLRPLNRIVMIGSWAYHQQSPTCTRDNHLCKLSNIPKPTKKPCNLWRSIFVTDHPIFVIKWHLWRNFISSWIEHHKSPLVTN
jgi:hypothetical protein